jgi:hypothetical protein
MGALSWEGIFLGGPAVRVGVDDGFVQMLDFDLWTATDRVNPNPEFLRRSLPRLNRWESWCSRSSASRLPGIMTETRAKGR